MSTGSSAAAPWWSPTATDPERAADRSPDAGGVRAADPTWAADPPRAVDPARIAERRLLAIDARGRRLVMLGGLALAAGSLLAAGSGLALSGAVAAVFPPGEGSGDAAPLLAAMVLLAVLRAVALLLSEVLAQHGSSRVRGSLRRALADRIAELGPLWSGRERSGELAAVLTSGLDAVDAYLVSFRPARLAAAAVPPLVLLLVLALDPLSALVLLVTGPVLLLLLAFIGGRARAVTERRFVELRWLGAFFLDMVQGLTTLKLFGRSGEQSETIAMVSRRYADATMEVLRTAFQTALVLEWAATVATAVVAVEAGLRLIDGSIPFERALAVIVVTPEFFLPLRQLSLRYHGGAAGRTAAERIFAILDEPGVPSPAGGRSPVGSAPASVPVPAGPPAIRFEGVGFAYPGRAPALDGVDLLLPAGTVTALTGPTGAGKSTLAALLLRFATPANGRITVDGIELGALPADAWLRRVAWVPQRPHLFDGSIADNLRLGRPDATDAELEEAVGRAHADGFVARLPRGFETRVGERGSRLSGGQLQRLAIARAWLRDAPLVIMDEATAHLDERSEALIRDAAAALFAGRTALVISHRRLLTGIADQVVELQAGRVASVTRGRAAGAAGAAPGPGALGGGSLHRGEPPDVDPGVEPVS